MGDMSKQKEQKIKEHLNKLMSGIDDTLDTKELNNRLDKLSARIDALKTKDISKRKSVPKDVVYELFNIALASGYIQGKITMIEKIQGSSSNDIDYIG
jgi:pantothenate kinase